MGDKKRKEWVEKERREATLQANRVLFMDDEKEKT